MKNNKELVSHLINKWILTMDSVIESFENIDRRDFVLKEDYLHAYEDRPLSIWFWQTISQPYTVAFMLELLWLNKWDKVLDVWSWSWWTTALIAYLVWEEWEVLWLELVDELVKFWKNNLLKYNLPRAQIIKSSNDFSFIDSKYDRILVSAASTNSIPKQLLKKLNILWVMAIPVDDSIYKVTKLSEDKIDIEKFYWFQFVPLIYND